VCSVDLCGRMLSPFAVFLVASAFIGTSGQATKETCGTSLLHVAGCAVGCNNSVGSSVEGELIACVLRRLGETRAGYVNTEGASRAEIYGEITSLGARMIDDALETDFGARLGEEDVVFDAGSGVGKLPIQYFLTTRVSAAIGVELNEQRCAKAYVALTKLGEALDVPITPVQSNRVLGAYSGVLHMGNRSLQLLCMSMLDLDAEEPVDLRTVSVVVVNSCCFPRGLLARFQSLLARFLQVGAVVLSSKEMLGCRRGIVPVGQISITDSGSVPPLFFATVAAPPIGAPVLAFGAPPNALPLLRDVVRDGVGVGAPLPSDTQLLRFLNGLHIPRPGRPVLTSARQLERLQLHRRFGQPGSEQLCTLSDLALHLVIAKEEGSGDLSEEDWNLIWNGGLRPAEATPRVMETSGETLLHRAVDLRSASLLRALVRSASVSPLATTAAGQTLCHREVVKTFGDVGGVSMLMLLGELDGNTGMAPGSLLPVLDGELGVDCGAPNAKGETPLHHAASHGHATSVAYLLQGRRELLSVTAVSGATPLHVVKSAEVAVLLLEAGADPNARDREGRTPLHQFVATAAELKDRRLLTPDLPTLLVNHGAAVNAADGQGRTALHEAAAAEPLMLGGIFIHEEVSDEDIKALASTLLDLGADVNAVDRDNRTPLHFAATEPMVQLLLGRGASMEAADVDGATPRDVLAWVQKTEL